MNKVYLAGPVSNVSYSTSEGWRTTFTALLDDAPHIKCYSPLRDKDYLHGETAISDSYNQTLFSNEKAIMTRDFFDVSTADALVVGLEHAQQVSIGTCMEIAWAYQRRIPIIVIGCNYHDHVMLRQAASWWNVTQTEAAAILKSLFKQ